MEVTIKNFNEALAKLKELLPKIDFVGFDSEFTGLGTSSDNRYNELDTVEERYQKARKAVKDHGMIQSGISLFRFCPKQKKYYSSTFCFFLSGKRDGCYKYDVSGMKFLVENGFDFNKLFLEGLPFMTITEEHEIRVKKEQKLANEQFLPSPIKLPDRDAKKFVKEFLKKVEDSKLSGTKLNLPGASLSNFHRKLLFNNVASHYPNSLFKTTQGPKRDIEVMHFNSLQEKDSFVSSLWEDDLLERMGFMRVIRLILESEKPLITHNGMLDILHFVDKFVSPLPETMEEFKFICKSNIPTIFDTKLFAKDPPFSNAIPNSTLGNLYKELTLHFKPPDVDIEPGCDSYKFTEYPGKEHDAGYDAFMTGICFLSLLKKLDGPNCGKSSLMQSQNLLPYANRINFMFSYDHAYIELQEKQVTPDRNHLLTVVCPPTFTMSDSRKLLKNISLYKLVWINDRKFHVIIEDDLNAKRMTDLIKELSSLCPPNVFVSKYKISDDSLQKESREIGNNGLNRKRSSDSDNAPPPEDGPDSDGLLTARKLKRLKSVGSSSLSQMTLESPTKESVDLPQESKLAQKEEAPSGAFAVPDEW